MDLGLANAKVLVTAASRGLGAATARRFSHEGAHVTISSRSQATLEQTAAGISAETGNPVHALSADVTDEAAVRNMVVQAATLMGGIDILVTNAGGPPVGSFDDLNSSHWQNAVALLLHSAVNLIQATLPYLRLSDKAAILTITSSSAKQPVANLTLSNTLRPAVILNASPKSWRRAR
jgi:3-oxoacyl-[acyl-carrier protein] reductase